MASMNYFLNNVDYAYIAIYKFTIVNCWYSTSNNIFYASETNIFTSKFVTLCSQLHGYHGNQ
jgi:hypothetical protein